MSEGAVLDPVEFIPERMEVALYRLGLEIREEGVDWGESAIEAQMIRQREGEESTDGRRPGVPIKIPIRVREEGGVPLAEAAHILDQVVGTWQPDGGWIRRDFADEAGFAGSLGYRILRHTATLSGLQGWLFAHRRTAPDVLLTAIRHPVGYSPEEIEGAVVEETSAREVQWTIEDPGGSAPGLIRVRVDNDNTSTAHWRSVRAAIECRDHPQDATANTTAALAYDCEDLTLKGGAELKTLAGSSGSKVVEHSGLTAGWLALLDSKIAGVGYMTHKGPRRIWVRAYDPGATAGLVELKLEWRALGSLAWTPNPVVKTPLVSGYCELDLDQARPQSPVLGDPRWEWRIMGRAPSGSGTIRLDRVRIEPTEQRMVVKAGVDATQLPDGVSTKSAGTVADESGVGTITWSNPSNAKASDDSRATAALTSLATAHYLKATNFSFALPEAATVLGIVVGVERSAEPESGASLVSDSRVRIVKAGSIKEAIDKASAEFWPKTTDAYKFYGDASDLWGQTWTPAEVNNSGFGVAIAAKNGAPKTASARVDHIKITVYYTEAADENRVCFATRSMEFGSEGVYRQHPTDDVWGKLVPEDGFSFEMPAGRLEGRTVRGIVVPSRGDLDAVADSETNKESVQVFYHRGCLFAREAL